MRISHGRSGRPVALALRALEVPVGLQERLLRQVLRVVVVAHPVVRVAVDVLQMGPVQLRELRVELRLVHASDTTSRHAARRRPEGAVMPRPTPRRRRGPRRRRPGPRCRRGRRGARASRRPAAAGRRAPRRRGRARARSRRRGGRRPSSSPARRLRLLAATTVPTRSPTPARPANVSGRAPRRWPRASTSAKTLPAAAPGGVGARGGRGGRGDDGGVLGGAGQLDADDVGRELGVEARRGAGGRRAGRRARGRREATTRLAPWTSASAAWPGPARRGDAAGARRARRRTPRAACPSAGPGPWRGRGRRRCSPMRSAWAATAAGSARAGTARTTRSAASRSRSAARATRRSAGSRTPGR